MFCAIKKKTYIRELITKINALPTFYDHSTFILISLIVSLIKLAVNENSTSRHVIWCRPVHQLLILPSKIGWLMVNPARTFLLNFTRRGMVVLARTAQTRVRRCTCLLPFENYQCSLKSGARKFGGFAAVGISISTNFTIPITISY